MKTLLYNLSIAFILLFALFSCTPIDHEKIAEEEIQKIMDETQAVGLSVAVVKDGEIAYTKAFGYKNLEDSIPLSTDDMFRIASISKSFSATAIMKLVEEGKISLDQDVSDLIGFKVRNPKFPKSVITLEMLLSHRSSLNDSQGYFTLDVINPKSNQNHKDCYNDYEPGTNYQYCNLNFNMVGTIIEKITGVRFDQYIVKNILEPLGLYGGYCVDSLDTERLTRLYSRRDGKLVHSPGAYTILGDRLNDYEIGYSAPIFSPTGGMKISAPDLARYMIMHMNYGEGVVNGEPVRIISEESSKMMQTKRSEPESYGYALREADSLWVPEYAVMHTGSAYGLSSVMYFSPIKKWGIVVINNGVMVDDDSRPIIRRPVEVLYEHIVNVEE